MTCDMGKVQAAIASLIARLNEREGMRERLRSQTSPSTGPGEEAGKTNGGAPHLVGLEAKEAMALRLDQQYPGGDVGVLSSFFLNLVGLMGL